MALADFAVSGGIGLAYSGSYKWGNHLGIQRFTTPINLMFHIQL
jgi:hypothetical protein